MNIQEIVFIVGNIVFILNLLPTLFNRNAKIPLMTSIPTAMTLFVFALAFYSIGYIFTALAQSASALLWAAIALWRHT